MENVAHREYICYQYFHLENMKGRDHLEDIGIYERIILEWIVGK
jgi:hypothetical protein